MAIPKSSHIWTYDDYMAMDDDGKRYEILDGELFEMPGPRFRHQAIIMRISSLLYAHVQEYSLGEVVPAPLDVVLSPVDVVQPDIIFISTANQELITELNVQGPPDLCVEVLSPGTSERDQGRKREVYARFGVREYWLVDPVAERVTVLVRDVGDGGQYRVHTEVTGETTIASIVLPGFIPAARALFPPA